MIQINFYQIIFLRYKVFSLNQIDLINFQELRGKPIGDTKLYFKEKHQ